MARERYLLDDTEDTIHKNEIKPQTAADKRKNWWDYHKVHVLLAALKPIFRSFSRNMQTTATVTAKHTSP